MSLQNIKDIISKITKPLAVDDANDIFYEIMLEKKLKQSEEDIKEGRHYTTEQVKYKLKKWIE